MITGVDREIGIISLESNQFSMRRINKLLTPRNIDTFSRVALFLVFAWFGFLKIVNISPARDLVLSLLHQTLPFVGDQSFMVFLGVAEVLIGILFLFRKHTRVAVIALLIHMTTTFLPLFVLADVVWQVTLVPSLVGQYILKNVALVALALSIWSCHSCKK